jgi:acetylornithine deacetylase
VNLNIGVLRAGDWPSTVAGRAIMECRVAFIPPQTMAEVRREVEDRVAATAAADPWLREHPPTVEWFGWQADPWRQEADHPFVATLAQAAQQVTGERPPFVASTAGLDTRFASSLGVAAACIGARGANMHGIDEYVEVESVIETVKIIAATIIDWCGIDA